MTKTAKMKICLAGEVGVGKTSLIQRFIIDVFQDAYVPTLGAKVTKKELQVSHPRTGETYQVVMMLWDVMGSHGFRELLKDAYFYGADGVLAVCDVTRGETLQNLSGWIQAIQKVAGDVPKCIVGNKVDMDNCVKIAEKDISRFSKDQNSSYLLTSAKTGRNVEPVFQKIAALILTKNAS